MTLKLLHKAALKGGVARLLSWMTSDHDRIFMYHRVSDDEGLISDGAICRSTFKAQLDLIMEKYEVVPLADLVSNQGSSRPRVALTFDDGYLDFYEIVFPILRRFKLPVTLFVCTRFADGDFWMWPDIVRFIREQGAELEDLARQSQVIFSSWGQLINYCHDLRSEERYAFLTDLLHIIGLELPVHPTKPFSGMSWEQIREVSASRLVDIGSHSLTHPRLSFLGPQALANELSLSRDAIKERTGTAPAAFCFPFGLHKDLPDDYANFLANAGYEYAVVAYPSLDYSDQYLIPRYPVSNNMLEFKKSLYGAVALRMKAFQASTVK